MKNQFFRSLILTPVVFLVVTTSAILLPGTRGHAIAIAQSEESVAHEDSSEEAEAKSKCDDSELVNCGQEV